VREAGSNGSIWSQANNDAYPGIASQPASKTIFELNSFFGLDALPLDTTGKFDRADRQVGFCIPKSDTTMLYVRVEPDDRAVTDRSVVAS
jgi:hypothetical protein